MKCPVLVIFFNRRRAVKMVIEALSKVRPPKIYLASDGARKNVPGEAALVDQIRREVIALINWECEVECKFEAENLGCKHNVSTSLKWFFGNIPEGIVLEDDCVPDNTFFEFAEAMLIKYRNDDRVGSIAGRNEAADVYQSEHPIFFSRKFFCWGWATWADRVEQFDPELGYGGLPSGFSLRGLPWNERLMMLSVIFAMKLRKDSWAYPLDLAFRQRGQLCLMPRTNLVRNVGLRGRLAKWRGLGQDSVEVVPNCSTTLGSVPVQNDANFMNSYIEKRFGGVLGLIGLIGWLMIRVVFVSSLNVSFRRG